MLSEIEGGTGSVHARHEDHGHVKAGLQCRMLVDGVSPSRFVTILGM
jgi:hypothetical protein